MNEEYGDNEISKGIFWFTCTFDEENDCDFSETELIALPVPCDYDGNALGMHDFNSREGTSFTHKASWVQLVNKRKELRKHSWNYFPRGRVEVRNHIATIYVNPHIMGCASYKQKIMKKFNLKSNIRVRIMADNSVHYNCYADDTSIQ